MTLSTHCLPSGSLGANEIPVSNVSSGTVTTAMPSGGLGNGNIRGIIINMHGLTSTYMSVPWNPGSTNTSSPGFSESYLPAFINNLNNDGWIVISVSYPEDFYFGIGSQAMWNDINSDSTHGTRYLTTQLHWWDHVVEYVRNTYGTNIPIVPFGISWGGWHTLQIAANRTSTMIAFFCHVPATMLSYANPAFTAPVNFTTSTVVNSINYGTPLSGGSAASDVTQHTLDNVTIPGLVGYGTNDEAVGWQTTASAEGVLPINSNIDTMLTSAYASHGTVLRNQTADYHELTNDDAGYSAIFTPAGPTALSSLGVLHVTNSITGYSLSQLVSGQCAIFASDNAWHTITFTQFSSSAYCSTAVTNVATSLPSSLTLSTVTGLYNGVGQVSIITTSVTLVAGYTSISGNTLSGVSYVSGTGNIAGTSASIVSIVTPLTGCSYSGNTAATVSAGAAVCLMGSSITGGYSNISYPYWISTTLDPIAPRTY